MATRKRKIRSRSSMSFGASFWRPIIVKWLKLLNPAKAGDEAYISGLLVCMQLESGFSPRRRNWGGGNTATGLFQQNKGNLESCSASLVRLMGQEVYDQTFGKQWSSPDLGRRMLITADVDGYLATRRVSAFDGDTSSMQWKGEVAIASTVANHRYYQSAHHYVPELIAMFQLRPKVVWGSSADGWRGMSAWYLAERNLKSAIREALYHNSGRTPYGDGAGTYILKFRESWKAITGSYPAASDGLLLPPLFILKSDDPKVLDPNGCGKGDGYQANMVERARRHAYLDCFFGEKYEPWTGPVGYSSLPPGSRPRDGGAGGSSSRRPPGGQNLAGTLPAPDVIFNDGTLAGNPFTSSQYITPEELERGQVMGFYNLNDWWINALNPLQQDKLRGAPTPKPGEKKAAGIDAAKSAGKQAGQGAAASSLGSYTRTDLLTDPRQRFISSLVESEFWTRRMAARTIPATSGVFNPYPVPGLPAIVLDKTRPVIAMLTSNTIEIDVQAARGSSSQSYTQPRYWDEGEIWYYLSGYNVEDGHAVNGVAPPIKGIEPKDTPLYRRFPHWHNRMVVPTNTVNTPEELLAGRLQTTDLDRFYNFHLGTLAVEYLSNHAKASTLSPDAVRRTIKERDPGDFTVNPSTLEIREYNRLIAETDASGRFAPYTLAGRFWGHIKPGDDLAEPDVPHERTIEYIERYGIKEDQLFSKVLKCLPVYIDGVMVYTGGAFGPEGQIDAIQSHILKYLASLEDYSIGGGVL